MRSSIVTKLFALLTVISSSRKPLTFSELVAATGMNKSTIHRLLSIGVEENLVQQDRYRKVYLLGPKVFDLVHVSNSGYDIQAIALDEMLELHRKFDGNVTIGVPSGMETVYLRILEADWSLSPTQRPGMREPMHCSASGKALLAFLPDQIIASKLAGHEFTRFTERTLLTAEAFTASLEPVRKRGFGANDREEYDYLVGISAPIFDYMEEPIAVLNIWCAHSQHPIEELLTWGDELRAAADRVSKLIGGVAPDVDKLRAK